MNQAGRGALMVDHDWGTTALWWRGRDGGWGNTAYEHFDLPEELVERMRYWCEWHDACTPELAATQIDWDLHKAYGLALAIDLKRAVGERYAVFCGPGQEIRLVEPPADVTSYPVGRTDA
jgi:hypothetical protein